MLLFDVSDTLVRQARISILLVVSLVVCWRDRSDYGTDQHVPVFVI